MELNRISLNEIKKIIGLLDEGYSIVDFRSSKDIFLIVFESIYDSNVPYVLVGVRRYRIDILYSYDQDGVNVVKFELYLAENMSEYELVLRMLYDLVRGEKMSLLEKLRILDEVENKISEVFMKECYGTPNYFG